MAGFNHPYHSGAPAGTWGAAAPAAPGGGFGVAAPVAGGVFGAAPVNAGGLFGATTAAPPYATEGFRHAHAPVAATGLQGRASIECGGHMFSLDPNAVTASHDISMVRLY